MMQYCAAGTCFISIRVQGITQLPHFNLYMCHFTLYTSKNMGYGQKFPLCF